jgi:hypothetical protein
VNCRASPSFLAAVIVVGAETVSKETASDLWVSRSECNQRGAGRVLFLEGASVVPGHGQVHEPGDGPGRKCQVPLVDDVGWVSRTGFASPSLNRQKRNHPEPPPHNPLHGERVEIVARYGRHALRVEQPDGQLRLLPVAWTDLVPRPAALAVKGRPVLLAPDALRELGAWIAARISRRRAPEKVASVGADAPKLKLDAAPPDGAAVHHHDGEDPPLVEQAGSPCAGCRGGRQQRGWR